MQMPRSFLPLLVLVFSAWTASGWAGEGPAGAGRAEAIRRYGLDAAVGPELRVKATPASVLEMFKRLGGPPPTQHALTEEERKTVTAAFAALPPLHRKVLAERLRTVSFLDGMPNTALTSTVNPDEPCPLFDITIRAGILHETVSDWLTQKERSGFDAAGSPLSVSVEAGDRDALVYVLLHEATHVVDSSLGLTPAVRAAGEPASGPAPATEFTRGIWSDRLVHVPKYRDPLLDRIRFRAGGRLVAMDQAEATYRALGRTPFVSLYGSSNWYDDLAEYVTVSHFTETLKQPFRIVIRRKGIDIYRYEPMKSDIVRERLGQMKRFYEVGA